MSAAQTLTAADLLVAECIEARKTFERAEVDYLEFLHRVERTRETAWKPGWGTFKSFLEQAVGLPRVSRYTEFCEAVASLGMPKVRRIGVDASVMALKSSSPAAQKKYEAAAEAWVLAHDGVHPAGDTPRKLLRQVDPQEEEPQAVGKMRELIELRAERDILKRRCHKLERENKTLRAENAKLKKK